MFKNKKRLIANIVGVLGIINTLLGLFHFFVLPKILKWGTELTELSFETIATINVLNIFMGILFVGFGVISFIYIPQIKRGNKTAWTFCLFLGIIWFIRTIMEPIYYGVIIEEIIFTFILLLISLSYLIPLLVYRKHFV